jgi:hypothetical protein
MLCNESMPFNSLEGFENLQGAFAGGLTFYKSELSACQGWNFPKADSLEFAAVKSEIPTLILSGELDPIAPPSNGVLAKQTLPNSVHYTFANLGHSVGSSSDCIAPLIENFLNDPHSKPNDNCVQEAAARPINFVNDVHINSGIYGLARKVGAPFQNIMFLVVPGALVLNLIVVAILSLFSRKPEGQRTFNILLRSLALIGVLFVVLAVMVIGNVANTNQFVLLFGLPQMYSMVLLLPYIFTLGTLLAGYLLIKDERRLYRSRPYLHAFFLVGCLLFIGFLAYNQLFY